jgi:hypothetical protein
MIIIVKILSPEKTIIEEKYDYSSRTTAITSKDYYREKNMIIIVVRLLLL